MTHTDIAEMIQVLRDLIEDGFTAAALAGLETLQRDVEALATQPAQAKGGEAVAWRWFNSNGDQVTNWLEVDPSQRTIIEAQVSDAGGRIEYAYTHPAPAAPVSDGVFDLICNAIDKADTITMEGDYMLDSDDCIAVVRVMQALLSVHHGITAQAKKETPCTKTWWRWKGTPQFEHGRATYFCGTVNEVSLSMPHFAQAHALANAIEAQAKATRHDARYGLLQEIGRIEP